MLARIVVYWQRIGFEVDIIAGDQKGPKLPDADWDLCYRRVRIEASLELSGHC